MGFFLFQWLVTIVGLVIHFLVDHAPARRTSRRFNELAALWVLVCGGAFGILGGIFHLGPSSDSIAKSIGYTQSMFQWEVGSADIALGILCVLCARAGNRGGWMSATLVALTVAFYGDGIGHIMQLVAHNNTTPDNVWALPSDFLMPTLAVVFTLLYRRSVHVDSQPAPQTLQDALA